MSEVVEDRAIDQASAQSGVPKSIVDRTLLILATFQNRERRLTLSEISRATGLPIATSHRIVRRLTEWGALEKGPDGRYCVGLRLWEVAALAPRPSLLRRIARPFMLELFEATGYTTHLAVRAGTELVSVERFHAGRHPVPRPLVGGRYPMHATSIGQVLLAYAPPGVRERVLEAPFERFTSRTMTTRAEVEEVVDRVRRLGYAICDRHVNEFDCSVAVPVVAPGGAVLAALSLAFTDRAVNPRAHLGVLTVTARRISAALRSVERRRGL